MCIRDSDSTAVHQLQGSFVVWLPESVRLTKFRETFAINTNYYPTLRKELVRLLKPLGVLESAVGHLRLSLVNNAAEYVN